MKYLELKEMSLGSPEKTWRKQMDITERKKMIWKGYIMFESNYLTFWMEKANYRESKND